jgi:hypothetical protein
LAAAYNSNCIGDLKYATQSSFLNPINTGSKLTDNKHPTGNASSSTNKRVKNTGSIGPGLFSPQNLPNRNSFGFGGIMMSP